MPAPKRLTHTGTSLRHQDRRRPAGPGVPVGQTPARAWTVRRPPAPRSGFRRVREDRRRRALSRRRRQYRPIRPVLPDLQQGLADPLAGAPPVPPQRPRVRPPGDRRGHSVHDGRGRGGDAAGDALRADAGHLRAAGGVLAPGARTQPTSSTRLEEEGVDPRRSAAERGRGRPAAPRRARASSRPSSRSTSRGLSSRCWRGCGRRSRDPTRP